ncbi:MAG TPA: poly-gamma-glutamate system protein, partial [Clostridia bacterium]|nr:poly-gamma-glutamate system protein [Clostridia bacterium]
ASAFLAVQKERSILGIALEPELDPNLTGLIGSAYSGITTTLGHLEAKRSTTNPNFSAIFIHYFNELGLRPGERVALNLSGSFPCVNIAAICAAEVMELEPVIMSSVGASSYGANIAEFTYPEMESMLYESGIIKHKSIYVSMGGAEDMGFEMDTEERAAVLARLRSKGMNMLINWNLKSNLDFRMSEYKRGGPIACCINVGGNLLSFAGSETMLDLNGGIVTALPKAAGKDGLIQQFVNEQTPVVHMLNMRELCVRYGLPIDPSPVPKPGEGGLYYETYYNRFIAGAVLILAFVVLFIFGRQDKSHVKLCAQDLCKREDESCC